MSGRQKRPDAGKSRPGSENNKPEKLSIDSLLDDIDSEEQKVLEDFPDIADAFGDEPDDFDDFGTDIEDIDDLDDDFDIEIEMESITEEKEATSDSKSASDTGNSGTGFWDDDDDRSGSRPSGGLMDSLRRMLQGDKGGKSNLMPLLIIALLVVIIIVLLMQNCDSGGTKQQDDWFDTSAIEGTLPGKSPEEIQAMLNQIVEEGMFNVSIAPVIAFENARAQGQARIENIPANHYHMSVKITLDETSETIYESKGIRPGQYIEYITLQKELSSGEYAATAMFFAYDPDDLSEQGKVAVKVKIIVE